MILLILIQYSLACTTIIAGKDATVNGSVMATQSDDGDGYTDPRIMVVPAQDYPKDSQRPIWEETHKFPRYVGDYRGEDYNKKNCELEGDADLCANDTKIIGYIPQVEHTYKYFDTHYGVMNEMGVGIGESTCSAKIHAKACTNPDQRAQEKNCALLSIEELSKIALERASSARQAVQIMGDLAQKYGFYGPKSGFENGAESLKIIDKNEGFEFEILSSDSNGSSAIWAAQRIDDDKVSVTANLFMIRGIDFHDSKNFLSSDEIHMTKYAQQNKLKIYKINDKFDFARTFSDGEENKFYNGRRIWRAFNLLNEDQEFYPDYDDIFEVYPFQIKPSQKIDVLKLWNIHRDTLNNTKYSLNDGLAAGPFKSPNRLTPGENEKKLNGVWERSIDIIRTSYLLILETHQNSNTTWYSASSPHASQIFPFPSDMMHLPQEFTHGWLKTQIKNSQNYVNLKMNTVMDLQFDKFKPKVESLQKQNLDFFNYLLTQDNKNQLHDAIKQYSAFQTQDWNDQAEKFIQNLSMGFEIDIDKTYKGGYPSWWLEKVGFQKDKM